MFVFKCVHELGQMSFTDFGNDRLFSRTHVISPITMNNNKYTNMKQVQFENEKYFNNQSHTNAKTKQKMNKDEDLLGNKFIMTDLFFSCLVMYLQ